MIEDILIKILEKEVEKEKSEKQTKLK